MSKKSFLTRLLTVLAVLLVLLVVWDLRALLLVVFAAIIVAVLVRRAASGITRVASVPSKAAVLLVFLCIALAVIGLVTALGPQMIRQGEELAQKVPSAAEQLRARLESSATGRFLIDNIPSFDQIRTGDGEIFSKLTGTVSTVFAGLTNAALIAVAGVFFALNPNLYVNGFLLLLPSGRRKRAKEILDVCGDSLCRWGVAQLVAMTAVGVLTTAGLWALGIPLALALGLLAGALNIVPFFGPILASIPAMLIGFSVDLPSGLYVALLFVGIQQIEGNLIQPIIQKQAVSLPPVVTLMSVIGFGALFGPLGVLLAMPLAVVAKVLLEEIYIKDVLASPKP